MFYKRTPGFSPKMGMCRNCRLAETDSLIFALNAVGRLNASFVCLRTYRGKTATKGKVEVELLVWAGVANSKKLSSVYNAERYIRCLNEFFPQINQALFQFVRI